MRKCIKCVHYFKLFVLMIVFLVGGFELRAKDCKSAEFNPRDVKSIDVYCLDLDLLTRQRLDEVAVRQIGKHLHIMGAGVPALLGIFAKINLGTVEGNALILDARIVVDINRLSSKTKVILYHEKGLITLGNEFYKVNNYETMRSELQKIIDK